jgi:hypothetical protein
MTQRGAMIITWGESRPGVTADQRMGVFAKALEYYDELAKSGRISGYRVYASTRRNHGSIVVEGELSTLAQIQCEEESLKQLALGTAVVENVDVERCIGGSPDDVAQLFATTIQAVADAGLAT